MATDDVQMDFVADRIAGDGRGRTNWNTFSSDQPTVSRPLFQSRPRPILITVSGIFLLSIFNILQRNQFNIQYLAHYFCRGTHLLRVSVYILPVFSMF